VTWLVYSRRRTLTVTTERVYLLKHILRLVVEPNDRQHKDIQKLHLNVTKLEEITNEALSAFFADKENPTNGKKRAYLEEIFQVAKNEERYLNGEVGKCNPRRAPQLIVCMRSA
jgi:hypothetical protein